MIPPEHTKWHKRVRFFKILADVANIGIVFHIIIVLLPFLLPATVLGSWAGALGLFSKLTDIITAGTDPAIYLCKGLNRGIRLYSRKTEDVVFLEETYGRHPKQNYADGISAALYSIAIAAFIISHFAFPFLSSIAWFAGLVGTGINIFFDETYPARLAANKYKTEPKDEIDEYYKEHYYESIFYSLLLISLFVFLPCKSLAQSHTLPAVTENIFKGIAAIGSMLVVSLNLMRAAGNLPCFLIYKKLPGLRLTENSSAPDSSFTPSNTVMSARLSMSPPASRVGAQSSFPTQPHYQSPIFQRPLNSATNTKEAKAEPAEAARACVIL